MRVKHLRERLATAMTAAYHEHLTENLPTKKQNRAEFLSVYGPAPDDDGLIAYFARRSARIAQEASKRQSGTSSR